MDKLREAFLAYRRKHGLRAALVLIDNFGGENGALDSVPEENEADLLAAMVLINNFGV